MIGYISRIESVELFFFQNEFALVYRFREPGKVQAGQETEHAGGRAYPDGCRCAYVRCESVDKFAHVANTTEIEVNVRIPNVPATSLHPRKRSLWT